MEHQWDNLIQRLLPLSRRSKSKLNHMCSRLLAAFFFQQGEEMETRTPSCTISQVTLANLLLHLWNCIVCLIQLLGNSLKSIFTKCTETALAGQGLRGYCTHLELRLHVMGQQVRSWIPWLHALLQDRIYQERSANSGACITCSIFICYTDINTCES